MGAGAPHKPCVCTHVSPRGREGSDTLCTPHVIPTARIPGPSPASEVGFLWGCPGRRARTEGSGPGLQNLGHRGDKTRGAEWGQRHGA